jgi:hypothetical protein
MRRYPNGPDAWNSPFIDHIIRNTSSEPLGDTFDHWMSLCWNMNWTQGLKPPVFVFTPPPGPNTPGVSPGTYAYAQSVFYYQAFTLAGVPDEPGFSWACLGGPYYGRRWNPEHVQVDGMNISTRNIEHVIPKTNVDVAVQRVQRNWPPERAPMLRLFAYNVQGDPFNWVSADASSNVERGHKSLACFSVTPEARMRVVHVLREDDLQIQVKRMREYFFEVPEPRRGYIALIQAYTALTYRGIAALGMHVPPGQTLWTHNQMRLAYFSQWFAYACYYEPCEEEVRVAQAKRENLREHLQYFGRWILPGRSRSWGNWLLTAGCTERRAFLRHPNVIRILGSELFALSFADDAACNRVIQQAEWWYRNGRDAFPTRAIPECADA